MNVLLDENLPHQLRLELPGHDVATATYMGLSGIENGELLRRAAEAGFEVLVTNDRGLEYQQNLASLPLSVVVVLAPASTIEAIRPYLPAVLSALATLGSKAFVKIERP